MMEDYVKILFCTLSLYHDHAQGAIIRGIGRRDILKMPKGSGTAVEMVNARHENRKAGPYGFEEIQKVPEGKNTVVHQQAHRRSRCHQSKIYLLP
jgi:hypothetical protein